MLAHQRYIVKSKDGNNLKVHTLETSRCYLRQWKKSDFTDFQKMNADPKVMRFFPDTLTSQQSDQLANKLMQLIEEKGWGLWVVEHKQTKQFMGFTGLHQTLSDLPIAAIYKQPGIEVSWRFCSEYWGMGYASEAANAVLKFAFSQLRLPHVISFTACNNHHSVLLMQRIGLTKRQHFEHPALIKEHPLSEHVLYAISNQLLSD